MVLPDVQVTSQLGYNFWSDVRPLVRHVFLTQEHQLIHAFITDTDNCGRCSVNCQCSLVKASASVTPVKDMYRVIKVSVISVF